MKTQYFFTIFAFLLVLAIVSATISRLMSVKELKENPEKYLGEEVTVSGIKEGNYSINIQSKELPTVERKLLSKE